MATAYTDSIHDQAITIAIDAEAWAQPIKSGWLTRSRELNRLLGKATHLLRIPAIDDAEPIWYAGVAGTSFAAGIERMAVEHDVLRDAIVAFPLDARIYAAGVENGLVQQEWVLYPDAFEAHVQTWREEGRTFTLLTGGGRQDVELPNAANLPVDIDTEAMTFKHASIALIGAGLLRWRDCVAVSSLALLTVGLSVALAWWQRAPSVEPLQRVAALIGQPAAPVRHTASAELAKLALLSAEHDEPLWRAWRATELRYDAAQGSLELHSATAAPVSALIGTLPDSPAVPPLLPYTVHEFHGMLAFHLESDAWSLAFGDPYPIGDATELEQHLTVSIGDATDPYKTSVTLALADLANRLKRVPITMHQANCAIVTGRFAACDLKFAIRGASA